MKVEDKEFHDKLDELMIQADMPFVIIFEKSNFSCVRSNLETEEDVKQYLEEALEVVSKGVYAIERTH